MVLRYKAKRKAFVRCNMAWEITAAGMDVLGNCPLIRVILSLFLSRTLSLSLYLFLSLSLSLSLSFVPFLLSLCCLSFSITNPSPVTTRR